MEDVHTNLLDMVGTPHSYAPCTKQIKFSNVARNEIFSPAAADFVRLHVLRKNVLINWKERFLENLCIGSNLPTFKSIHSNSYYNTSDYYAISLKEPIIDLKTGSVFLNASTAWADSCFASIMHGPVHLSPAVEALGNQRFFNTSKARISWIDISVPVMPFCHWASLTNYGHWLANSLIASYLMLPELQSGNLFLIGPRLSDRQKRELLMIGVPNRQIIETDAQYVSAPNVVYCSAASTIGNMAPSPVCMEALEKLKGEISVQIDQVSPEYLYVARKGASHTRSMLNESELIQRLNEIGFTTIYPHDLGFDAQVTAFSKAKIIIGQLGAALWSMPFAPKGGTYIEISTSNYASNEYVSIANLMNRNSIQIMVDPIEEGGKNDVVLSFNAPIDQIISIAAKFI